jgi:Cytochrome b(C-terminal)/b6/petD
MRLDASLQNGLAVFYLLVAIMNFAFAACYGLSAAKDRVKAGVWAAVGGLFLIHAIAYFAQLNWIIPQQICDMVNFLLGPVMYTSLSIGLFVVMLYFRRFFTNPQVAWAILNLSLLFGGWAMTQPDFRSIVAKPDNVPISMLIYAVGFCTWLGMYRAVQNDDRMARGEPVLEKLDDDKVLVWPDLVYTELIAMIVCTFVLVVWAILLKAPLEQPATSAKAPNPSKAPWYFLGLQEMLVYFDPWMAGVVLPTMIIVGLMAMPYIDFNREGNGYFSYRNRMFSMTIFMFGFLVLWVTLIVLGTFLRGPNWNFFGPFAYWDAHKVDPLNNVNVSDIFWLRWLGTSPADVRFPIPTNVRLINAIWRELPGLILVALYMLALPPLLAMTIMRGFFLKMGFVRFMILVTLMQFMASLPIKMVLRWTINLKYIVYIPEIFFNI